MRNTNLAAVDIDKTAPLDGIALERADLEWLVRRHQEKSVGEGEQPRRLNLQSALLSAVDGRYLPLEGANFSGVQLENANFSGAQLEGAIFIAAQLEGADFGSAQLEGAIFVGAQLEGANFVRAQLEGAKFIAAQLEGADFRLATISKATFGDATMITTQGIGPIVADVAGWDEHSLPINEWSRVKQLGDEAEAKKKRNEDGKPRDATTRFRDYFAATRAYRQVATALDGMGRKEEAEKFAYRGQVMQRKMFWWSIWQKKRRGEVR